MGIAVHFNLQAKAVKEKETDLCSVHEDAVIGRCRLVYHSKCTDVM